jgi:hypothetical protein
VEVWGETLLSQDEVIDSEGKCAANGDSTLASATLLRSEMDEYVFHFEITQISGPAKILFTKTRQPRPFRLSLLVASRSGSSHISSYFHNAP